MDSPSGADSGGCDPALEEKEESLTFPEGFLQFSADLCKGRRRRQAVEFGCFDFVDGTDRFALRPIKQSRFESSGSGQEIQDEGDDEDEEEQQQLERDFSPGEELVTERLLWRPDCDFVMRVPLGTEEISHGDGEQRASSEVFDHEAERLASSAFPSPVQEITSAVAMSNVQNGGSSGDDDDDDDDDSQSSSSGSGSTSTGSSSSMSSSDNDNDSSGSENNDMEGDSPASSNVNAEDSDPMTSERSSAQSMVTSKSSSVEAMDSDHQHQEQQQSATHQERPSQQQQQQRELAESSSRNQPDVGTTMPPAPSKISEDGPCPSHGMVSVCGRRREMEDAVSFSPTFLSLPVTPASSSYNKPGCNSFHFFGVYDGHGGAQAAEYCAERLHHLLAEEMLSLSESTSPYATVADNRESMWKKAMATCFMKMDAEVAGVCWMGDQCGIPEGTPRCCADPVAPETVGSTAVIAAVSSCQIVIGNCGDSRAVLSRRGRSIALTEDHKPDRDDELARIENAGGRVIFWNGHRVMGVLAMSRAIGDQYLKPYVIAVPDVTCYERTDEDECLVLASDGLWDVFSNEHVCEVARKMLRRLRPPVRTFLNQPNLSPSGNDDTPAAAAAAKLTEMALGRGSSDNISVVVVDLRTGSTGASSRRT